MIPQNNYHHVFRWVPVSAANAERHAVKQWTHFGLQSVSRWLFPGSRNALPGFPRAARCVTMQMLQFYVEVCFNQGTK